MALLLLVTLVTLFISPIISTSRNAFVTSDIAMKSGFQVTLKHIDSGLNLTKFELLQRAMKRGRKRIENMHSMALATSDPSIDAPLHAGSGEFLMELAIGTPPIHYSAIIDTGSDLIWTQCKPCQHCFKQQTTIFDPRNSSSYSKLPCSSDLCDVLPTSSCTNSNCEYLYSYGDYSSTQGIMAVENFTFNNVSVPNVTFGCGADNHGGGFNQGAGLIGMGRGPLSLVSQLDESKFSYCLTSIDSKKASSLMMGSKATSNGGNSINTTPLIKSKAQPTFYYLSLQGISVGPTRLPIENSTFELQSDGTGGMIIDSGTTLTYLEESAFDVLKTEFTNQVKFPVGDSGDTGLELCFTVPSNETEIAVPKLTFHFEGADLLLPADNYMIGDPSGMLCLAMGSSSGMSIFGNFQQQDTLVVHDLVHNTISFQSTQCDELLGVEHNKATKAGNKKVGEIKRKIVGKKKESPTKTSKPKVAVEVETEKNGERVAVRLRKKKENNFETDSDFEDERNGDDYGVEVSQKKKLQHKPKLEKKRSPRKNNQERDEEEGGEVEAAAVGQYCRTSNVGLVRTLGKMKFSQTLDEYLQLTPFYNFLMAIK